MTETLVSLFSIYQWAKTWACYQPQAFCNFYLEYYIRNTQGL